MNKLTQEQQDKIILLYQEGNSIMDIVKITKNGKNTIHRIIKKAGIARDKNKFDEETEIKIIEEYLDGASSAILGEKYSCDRMTICNIVKRHDLQPRSRGKALTEFSNEEKALIDKMWADGCARWNIMNTLGVSSGVIDNYLKNKGEKIETRIRSGENHASWKGGRIENGQGYIMILADKNDPYYEMANSIGYILEHRYVIAKHLGKIIPSEWSIHHVDGDKTNNDLSNLELRQGQHLPGAVYICEDCGSKNIVAVPLTRTDYTNEDKSNLIYESSKFSDEIQKDIVQKYISGTSISELARNYECGRVTISNVLCLHNIDTFDKFELCKDQLTEMRDKGISNSEIKKELEISDATLCRWVKKLGLPVKRDSLSREEHGQWKGGKCIIHEYIYLHISKEDPFYCMINGQGYIAEHRYVMAKHLNRPLTGNEKVHHIDGNPQNNNIENLQLVIQDHGKGQTYECQDCGSINITNIPLGETEIIDIGIEDEGFSIDEFFL